MAFPTSPANNQVSIVNGIEYVWNASKGAWYRYGDATVNVITANTFQALSGVVFSDGTIQTTASSGGGGSNTYLQGAINSANANISLLQAYSNQANANISLLFGIETSQNANVSLLQTYSNQANANISLLQAYSNQANANISLLQAYSNQANANISLLQAYSNQANANISLLFGIETTQNTNITAANNLAQGAFNKANSAIANTSGVVTAGDFVISGNTTIKQLTSTYNGTNGGATFMLSGTGTQGGAGYFDFIRANNTTNGTSAMSFRLDNTGTVQLVNSAYTATVFSITQTGVVILNGASSANNDATTAYINFNNQNSVMYDDGNLHIHTRTAGQSMWINTNGGDLRFLQQSPVNGGSQGNSVIVGGAQNSTATAFLNVLGSKSYAVSSYGYLSTGGAGTVSGSSGTVSYGIYNANRMQSSEVDVTSDERAKNIQGTIPLDSALKFVKEVDGILYTWKPDATDAEHDPGLKSGFGAQSVHKAGFDHMIGHIPNPRMEESVDDDGWVHPEGIQLTMGYNQAIPYHHEVIKHLLNKIEQLEKTVEELKSNK
jgi:hypothetical protein